MFLRALVAFLACPGMVALLIPLWIVWNRGDARDPYVFCDRGIPFARVVWRRALARAYARRGMGQIQGQRSSLAAVANQIR
jgi:hypothetical protein